MSENRLSVKQPYFFPYIGYFSQINYADTHIFFDTPQYERRGWMNRNRILNSEKDFTYITVPLKKAKQSTAICEIEIDNSQDWKDKILSQLIVYKKRAPFYNEVIDFVAEILSPSYDSLSSLNIELTKKICERLNIKTKFDTFSQMDLEYDEVNAKDEWALNITKALGYPEYIESTGAIEYFDRKKFEQNDILLKFFKPELTQYIQKIGRFVEGLSIIDVMMFNSVEQIQEMMSKFTIIQSSENN